MEPTYDRLVCNGYDYLDATSGSCRCLADDSLIAPPVTRERTANIPISMYVYRVASQSKSAHRPVSVCNNFSNLVTFRHWAYGKLEKQSLYPSWDHPNRLFIRHSVSKSEIFPLLRRVIANECGAPRASLLLTAYRRCCADAAPSGVNPRGRITLTSHSAGLRDDW